MLEWNFDPVFWQRFAHLPSRSGTCVPNLFLSSFIPVPFITSGMKKRGIGMNPSSPFSDFFGVLSIPDYS